jgi:hypothetical protein
MKKLLTIGLLILSAPAFSQGVVKNGTIYKQHPYITDVLQLNASFAKGDTLAVAGYYADTARFIDASNPMKPSSLAQSKATWRDILANWNIVSMKQIGYPDGLEYASSPFVVQSWWEVTSVNKKTQKKVTFEEVIFDSFNKAGKITSELSYYDTQALLGATK